MTFSGGRPLVGLENGGHVEMAENPDFHEGAGNHF
jgi:hypothetical protein